MPLTRYTLATTDDYHHNDLGKFLLYPATYSGPDEYDDVAVRRSAAVMRRNDVVDDDDDDVDDDPMVGVRVPGSKLERPAGDRTDFKCLAYLTIAYL